MGLTIEETGGNSGKVILGPWGAPKIHLYAPLNTIRNLIISIFRLCVPAAGNADDGGRGSYNAAIGTLYPVRRRLAAIVISRGGDGDGRLVGAPVVSGRISSPHPPLCKVRR